MRVGRLQYNSSDAFPGVGLTGFTSRNNVALAYISSGNGRSEEVSSIQLFATYHLALVVGFIGGTVWAAMQVYEKFM
jgi:hypothetical protein